MFKGPFKTNKTASQIVNKATHLMRQNADEAEQHIKNFGTCLEVWQSAIDFMTDVQRARHHKLFLILQYYAPIAARERLKDRAKARRYMAAEMRRAAERAEKTNSYGSSFPTLEEFNSAFPQ